MHWCISLCLHHSRIAPATRATSTISAKPTGHIVLNVAGRPVLPNRRVSRYFCRYCNKGFYSISGRVQHERKHKGTAFRCAACGLNLQNRTSLEMHKAEIHENRKIECERCNKTFTRRYSLQVHQKRSCFNVRPKWLRTDAPFATESDWGFGRLSGTPLLISKKSAFPGLILVTLDWYPVCDRVWLRFWETQWHSSTHFQEKCLLGIDTSLVY